MTAFNIQQLHVYSVFVNNFQKKVISPYVGILTQMLILAFHLDIINHHPKKMA